MKHTVKQLKLDNGAAGLAVRVPGVEVVRILVEFHAGFDFADFKQYELPHVMEHMMFTNKTYPKPRQFSREVEKNGAFNNAYTSGSSLEYDYECAAFEAGRIADLIRIQLTEPIFPEAELKTELGNVAEELNTGISSPAVAAFDNLHVASTGVPSKLQRCQQLPTIKAADLQRWYRDTHTANNMRFIVAGDIDFAAEVLPRLNVSLPTGKRLKQPNIVAKTVPEPVVEARDIPQIYYNCFSNLNARMTYRELIAARIISAVLANGFSSTLLGTAREKGLVYGFNMGIGGGVHDATWQLSGAVSPEHATEFFQLVKQEISNARLGAISQKQFTATKKLLQGQRARQYQRIGNLVNFYDAFFTTGFQEFDSYDRFLAEISLKEATTAFNRLFNERIWGISFVGNINATTAKDYRQRLQPLFA